MNSTFKALLLRNKTGVLSVNPIQLGRKTPWQKFTYLRSFSEHKKPEDEFAPHFKRSSIQHPLSAQIKLIMEEKHYTLPHPIWNPKELNNVEITHVKPSKIIDKLAYGSVQTLRFLFDVFSGYYWGKLFGTLNEKKWLRRIIFLETVAGVPGMIAAMIRHLRSLRYMERDHGWIHTLLGLVMIALY
jgi:muramoyltetrapeptide carboxypeptidase LdcA involved in peptidoglycan recycling